MQPNRMKGRDGARRAAFLSAAAVLALLSTAPVRAELDGTQYMKLHVRADTPAAIWASGEGLVAGGTAPEVIASRISSQPQARWYSNWPTEGLAQIRGLVAAEVRAAFAAGAVPQLVPYMIPNRDCSSLSGAGSAQNMTEWYDWINQFALGIQDGFGSNVKGKYSTRKVIVLLEPDALALQSGDEGCVGVTFNNHERNNAISAAVQTLTGAACWSGVSRCSPDQSSVKVFLDAGHSEWYNWGDGRIGTMDANGSYISECAGRDCIADRLYRAGIAAAAGFFTNVSNYQTLAEEEAYGSALRAALGRKLSSLSTKLQVIDTSRAGVDVGDRNALNPQGWPTWCDNDKARLGPVPTIYANHDSVNFVAARLWVKPPGETDGCYDAPVSNPGTYGTVPSLTNSRRIPAGAYDADRACMLINGERRGAAPLGTCGAIDLAAKPPAPTGLRVTSVTRGSGTISRVQLEWEPSTGACHYQIQRGINGGGLTAGGGTFDSMISGSGGVGPRTVWIDEKIPAGTTRLQYRVRARACGASNYAASSTVTIVP